MEYMKKISIAVLCLLSVFLSCTTGVAGIKPERLTCEDLKDPSVIDVPNPRLSWINSDPSYTRNQSQTAWQIIIASSREELLNDNGDLWNSGKVNSSQSFNIIYKGKPLQSRQDCWWKVRVWDSKGRSSEWSEAAFFSTGLAENEWKALWIGAPWQ